MLLARGVSLWAGDQQSETGIVLGKKIALELVLAKKVLVIFNSSIALGAVVQLAG